MKFINLDRQYQIIKNKLDIELPNFLSKGEFILGKVVENLESRLAQYTMSKYSLGVSSGTDALLIALMALKIRPGDEVIVPSFTFGATVDVVVRLGATPVFADINPDTYILDEVDVKKKITKNTKAIIFVSLYGNLTGIHEIKKIGQAYGVTTIEDAAQSFGSTIKEKKSCNILDISCTSFFPTKPLGCYGDGGAIFFNDAKLYHFAYELRVHGQKAKYNYEAIGIAGRLDAIQALVLDIKLDVFDEELKRRRAIAKVYDSFFDELGIKRQNINDLCFSSYGLYTIELKNRKNFLSEITAAGIPVSVHYPIPLHKSKAFSNYFKGKKLTVSEEKSEKVLSIPLCPYIKKVEVENIKKNIAKIYFNSSKNFYN